MPELTEKEQVSEATEVETTEEATDKEETGATPVPSEEEPSEEASEESTEEEESIEEATSKQPESVRQLVDAALRRSAERYGRQVQEVDRSQDRETGLDDLISNLTTKLRERKQRGEPSRFSEVDTNDPSAIDRYVESKIESVITKRLGPTMRTLELREVENEFSKLVADHGDYHKYGKKMAELIEAFPNLPLEDAYKIASYGAQKKKGSEEVISNMKKKKVANLASTSIPIEEKSTKKVKNIREAILAAMDETGFSK